VKEHLSLLEAARRKNVIVAVEMHKRWDPIYDDARARIATFGMRLFPEEALFLFL